MTKPVPCGVLYVAAQKERYLQEAIASATSLKYFCPDLPVCLFTDLTDSSLSHSPCFDIVRSINADTACGSSWALGLRARMLSLSQTPFERTFHLDTDTRFLTGELENVFSILDDCDLGIVEDNPDVSIGVKNYGNRMFNVGVMVYRKCSAIDLMLEKWQQLFLTQLQAIDKDPMPKIDYMESIQDPVTRRKMLAHDQFAFVQLINPDRNTLDVKVKVLDEAWNFTGTFVGRGLPRPIHVDHGPHLKVDAFTRAGNKVKPKSLNQMVNNLMAGLAKASYECKASQITNARQTLENAISAIPNQSLIQLPLAREAANGGDYLKACIHAQSAIHADPTCWEAFIELASAQFNRCDYEAAANTVNRFRSRFPKNQAILALASIVDEQRGVQEHPIAATDYTSLVWQTQLRPDPILKKSLIDFVCHQRLLESEKPAGVPDNVYITRHLTPMAGPQVGLFEQLLRPKLEQYIQFLTRTKSALLQFRPSRLSISCWGTVTGEGGFTNSHVHNSAWLSGVVYLKVPTHTQSPNIEFGRPPADQYAYTFDPVVYSVKTQEDLMLIHPSHYWSGTQPNTHGDLQVSIGFTVSEPDNS